MVELWNSAAVAGWSTRPDRYDAMLSPLGERVLQAVDLQPGERVLDVGCGGGQLSRQAAVLVGTAGSVLGVDVSTPLVTLAAQRATEAGLDQVAVMVADAQVLALPAPPFDAVISRFGVMFFDDPIAAFANLLSATTPGGRLCFVSWQAAPSNEWLMVPMAAFVPHLGMPDLPPPGAPGPFAFGDADHVRQILSQAGWADVDVADVQMALSVGGAMTAEDAVAFTSEDTFGSRLLAQGDAQQRTAALAALRAAYASRLGPEGVRLNAAAWVVTARAPSFA